jgi:Tfp pilus assembly protein PilN
MNDSSRLAMLLALIAGSAFITVSTTGCAKQETAAPKVEEAAAAVEKAAETTQPAAAEVEKKAEHPEHPR